MRYSFADECVLVVSPYLRPFRYMPEIVGSNTVDFVGKDATLRFFRGHRSHNLDLEMRRDGESINLLAFERAVGMQLPGLAVRENVDLTRARLRLICEFLVSNFSNVLSGDDEAFKKVLMCYREQNRRYTEALLLGQIVEPAKAAFKAGQYQRVVDMLTEVEDKLTPVMRKKLEYARKRTSL